MPLKIPYNRPYLTGNELEFIQDCHLRGQLAGDGYYTKQCEGILEEWTGSHKVLLANSCTAALEMSAMLTGVGEGDEVIMPSYTFVSTANAFALRGAKPVFIDIRPDTLNMNEELLQAAVTDKTKAVVPVHYAGVGCEMEPILDLAAKYGLKIIEDAAQGILATYKGQALGAIGNLGTFSFHETKNVISGEGGALLVNCPQMAERAEHIREKGTNRAQFFRGEIDKYTWVDLGSSYLPGEIIAAFLHAQLTEASIISQKRMELWEAYNQALEPLEEEGLLKRPTIPSHCRHNAHLYYVLLPTPQGRDNLMVSLREKGIQAIFHYIPLHSSPAGKKYARTQGSLPVTEDVSKRILRLPIWLGMPPPESIVREISTIMHSNQGKAKTG